MTEYIGTPDKDFLVLKVQPNKRVNSVPWGHRISVHRQRNRTFSDFTASNGLEIRASFPDFAWENGIRALWVRGSLRQHDKESFPVSAKELKSIKLAVREFNKAMG